MDTVFILCHPGEDKLHDLGVGKSATFYDIKFTKKCVRRVDSLVFLGYNRYIEVFEDENINQRALCSTFTVRFGTV